MSGAGSGVLSFVAARLGAKRVIGCDLSEEAVETARENACRLGLADRSGVPGRRPPGAGPRQKGGALIIGDVSGIPDGIARVAGWFPDGGAGGPTGAEFPAAMLESSGTECLAYGGRLYLPTGTIQDEKLDPRRRPQVFGAAT